MRKLKEAGFRRRKDTITAPLSEGWQGWVGLNSGGWTPRDGVMYPIIGVICDEIERIYYEIQPHLPGRNYPTPTITIPLGYAAEVPKLRQWFFTNDDTVEDQAADLVQAVVDIGIPYMRKHASLDAIRATLSGDNMIPNPSVAREKLAIVIFMQDGPQAARAQVEADPIRATARAIAWTERAVLVEWDTADGHTVRAWVWASAVERITPAR